jgi:hypothetical protein
VDERTTHDRDPPGGATSGAGDDDAASTARGRPRAARASAPARIAAADDDAGTTHPGRTGNPAAAARASRAAFSPATAGSRAALDDSDGSTTRRP